MRPRLGDLYPRTRAELDACPDRLIRWAARLRGDQVLDASELDAWAAFWQLCCEPRLSRWHRIRHGWVMLWAPREVIAEWRAALVTLWSALAWRLVHAGRALPGNAVTAFWALMSPT